MLTDNAVIDEISSPEGGPDGALFADFIQSARIELCAALQLLAERVLFVTSATRAAIAIEQEGGFVYSAAAGNSAPEIGTEADVRICRDCLVNGKPLLVEGKLIAVPIIRDSKTAGFIELFSEVGALGERDIEATIRLAEMVDTALDHMEAAEQAEPLICSTVERVLRPEPRALQLAAEPIETAGSQGENTVISEVAAGVHACPSCGFPISKGRRVCVDCERMGTTAPSPTPTLFKLEEQESWLSAHGYTIASLLIPALVAALIYWLH